MYILVTNELDLVITVNTPIYRGTNLAENVIYLIPASVGNINTSESTIYLCYIRPDGMPDIIVLERMDEMYNDTYFQYRLAVDRKITKYPGQICTWLTFYCGSPQNPVVQKTGECILAVMESKDIDDYMNDQCLDALYKMQVAVSELQESANATSYSIAYDDETRVLQLMANGVPTGSQVTVPSDEYHQNVSDEVEDTWSDMGGSSEDDSSSSESWDDMGESEDGSDDSNNDDWGDV